MLNKKGQLNRFVLFFKQLTDTPSGLISMASTILLVLIFLAVVVFSDYITVTTSTKRLLPPAWATNGSLLFLLGTDNHGHDIFSQLILGTAPTLGAAFLITGLITMIGFLLNMTKFLASKLFFYFNFVLNTLFIIPSLFLVIIVVVLIGNSPNHVMLAMLLISLPRFVNRINYAINQELGKEYITAAKLDGFSKRNILFSSVLPNVRPIYIFEITSTFSNTLLKLSILSFLGFPFSPHANDWGTMMKTYFNIIDTNLWAFIAPGLALFIAICIVRSFSNTLLKTLG